MTTREELIAWFRSKVKAPYAPQGRSMQVGYDCGSLFVDAGITFDLADLTETGKLFEVLKRGYAQSPDGESYEAALAEQLDLLPVVLDEKPNLWNAEPGDVLAFDFGKGIQHIALVTKWNGRRFTVIHAIREFGVVEGPLPFEYVRALRAAYRIRGVT